MEFYVFFNGTWDFYEENSGFCCAKLGILVLDLLPYFNMVFMKTDGEEISHHEIWCCYKIQFLFAPFVSPFVKHEIFLLSAYETQLSGLSVRRGTGGRCGSRGRELCHGYGTSQNGILIS